MILLVGVNTHNIYAKGRDKAECMRKLQNMYPGKLDERTRKLVGKTTNYNNSDIMPEPMRFYKSGKG